MEEKYLPIGTVCRLQGATRSLMIVGFGVRKPEEEKVYDYLGCLYPQGKIDPNANFLFDHSQIEEILHKGLVNEEEIEFKKFLVDAISSKLVEKKNSTEQPTVEVPQTPVMPSMPEMSAAPQPTEPVTTAVPNMFWSNVDTTNSTTN